MFFIKTLNSKLRAYTESQAFLWRVYARGEWCLCSGALYTEPFLCMEFFTHSVCISKNVFHKFGNIIFIKTSEDLKRRVNFGGFIKNNTPPHIFYICRMGLHFGFLYADPLLCYYFDAGAYIRWGIYSEFYGTVK